MEKKKGYISPYNFNFDSGKIVEIILMNGAKYKGVLKYGAPNALKIEQTMPNEGFGVFLRTVTIMTCNIQEYITSDSVKGVDD